MAILLDRIVINPDVMVGKPIIKGTRLTVQHILGLMAEGITIEDILADHPNITREDILACLMFAHMALESTTFAPIYSQK